MACELNQVKITNKAKPEDLAERLKRLPETLKSFTDPKDKEACPIVASSITALETSVPPNEFNAEEFKKWVIALHPAAKRDLLEKMRAVKAVCDSPSEAGVRALIVLEHQQDTRTCKLFGNHYRQSFKLAEGGNWVHTSEPTGPCGTVFVTEFQKESSSIGLTLWNHRTRKIITNPSGTNVIMKCSDFDEATYTYVWRKEPVYRGCDYIDYGF